MVCECENGALLWRRKFGTFKTFEIMPSNIKELCCLVDGGGESKNSDPLRIRMASVKQLFLKVLLSLTQRIIETKSDGSDNNEVLKM
ncbi:hypothetical protein GCM10019998_20720 [Tetragenococcus solitarius]|uniref:Uncharacterized protein n=1 Tax=Tetragenococcus solitarius TaxID=71453 RepID=A0ABN3YF96_9ENTE